MDKSIISRFLNGELSPSESEQVNNWLDKLDASQKLDQMFLENWNQKGLADQDEERNKKLLNRINKAIHEKQTKPKVKAPYLGVSIMKSAAIWLLFIGMSYLAFLVVEEHNVYVEDKVVSYHWIERNVRPGHKLELVLPDKSKVLVNSNSKIKFPSSFGPESRNIYLEGEAFFEVKKEADRPFRVYSGGLTTEVLGTKFNIRSGKQKTDVALLEGRVKVSISEKAEEQLILIPGQLVAYYPKKPENLHNSTFDIENSFLWKDGIIRFDNESFKSIIQRLEKWYGVDFQVKGKVNLERTVSGSFANDNLKNMLTGLAFTLDFIYVIEKDFITIYPT